jgi:hypothetical protein
MSIILLRGFSHSGKDYVGNILCEKYGYVRFAFADSLKKLVSNEFNYPLERLHTQEGKLEVCKSDSIKRTYRQILIDEALRMRNIDAGIFAKYCCQDILDLNSVPDKIVITDWRYPNEIDIVSRMFSDHKVTPIIIQRIGQDKSPVLDKSEYHLVERKGDYIIQNNLDVSIYEEVDKLIRTIS